MNLPVQGNNAQFDRSIDLVNRNKRFEEQVLRALDELAKDPDVDPRWLATGRTDIEKGFMSVNRSIFKPGRVDL